MTGSLVEQVFDPSSAVPLGGIRVLDLSRLVSGNMVTHVLADYGAEVVKVERPGVGDDLRNWKTDGISTHWKVYCRNKKSISLDLRRERGRDLLLELASTAHVLVENFKPGTMEKWGLGPDVLWGQNSALIIVRISGWGQTGPWSHKPGFGSLVEAMSGFAAMNGFADRPPVLPPLALADMIAGLYGAFSIMVALREIEQKNGSGQVIDLSLFEPILSVLGPIAAIYSISGDVPNRTGSLSETTSPRNVYETKDGKFVALSASMQAMSERLMKAIGRPDLIDDPRFLTNTDRVRNNYILDPIVAEFMKSRTQMECLEIFEKADVTVGAVADIAQLIKHPYVHQRGSIVNLPDSHTKNGKLPAHAAVPRLSKTPAKMRSEAPDIGEHNDQIFSEIGLSKADIIELSKQGVI
ncbi:MAG: CoA transferase [Rhodospirillaceae bacterium]|nr:CoA transferase [Rhodospirillaceae bacterium]|tara:strand:+ start:109 stop:1338 length:1230 start_codon:yes stop_codon:yes gene_type:complete